MKDDAEESPPCNMEELLDYERRAEIAYKAMYDAPSYDQKDLKDDALFYLAQAIKVAEALGLRDDASRLKASIENIIGVYNSQFRGNFR